jgi:hypothetical protein
MMHKHCFLLQNCIPRSYVTLHQVCSPVVKTSAVAPGTTTAAAAKFSGNLYMKCMSLAGALEWIMCDSLRSV